MKAAKDTFRARLAAIWLAGACFWASAAIAADQDAIMMAIGAELDALMNPEVSTIHGAPVALGDTLREFYSRREFRAAWTNAQPREQLLQALADSYHDGLNPDDYHLPLLQDLSKQ